VGWLSTFAKELVIEFVHKNDAMVTTLLRNKRDDYADYEIGLFERLMSEAFHVVRRETLACETRTLYHAVAKSSSVA
jgi:hypothetical protein